ncbi:putative disease resistance protein RGA1 isoform X2 [Rosa chinensis]|uniref:putative disease resistance protein RGA1 isoform X2 n=1 Tax=Rosa chinensis TaxID=74649 RepID=UPI000D08BEE1|nr:putative disease resistance protein RGA1 isoform X2 [Rosa chinensis]
MLSRREARAHSSNNFIFDYLFFFSYNYNQVITQKMAEALISVLLEQLASVVYQHTNEVVKLVLNADKDVKSFSSKLKAIQAVLEDAEKKQVTEASVGDWLQKLKDVSYEMDDVLDEWNTELLRQQAEEKQEVEGDNALVTKKKFLTQKECTIIEAVELPGDYKVRHLTLTSLPEGPLSFPTSFDNCKNMRTLTLLDSSITTISPGSIMQMKCLRTLNLSGNKTSGSMLNEVPKEIGKLIHLRYMDLSWNHNLKELPDAVCDLYNLQTLDVSWCDKLEKLPKAMGKLINLKHLYVWASDGLRYLPKGIGSLKSLQVLDCFYVCEGDDDEALKLGDLGIMDQLQGSLVIDRLGNKDDASEIDKAQLGKKEHLSHLGVWFLDEEQRKGDEEIVKALQPHQNLESLEIWDCHIGTTESLYWIKSLRNLRRVELYGWKFCEFLPPLGKLPSLEILEIRRMEKVKKAGVEFLGIEGEEEVSGILFPKLKRLAFESMENWEEWAFLSEITIMPRLSELQIERCPKLKALPEFLYKITALRTLAIMGCPILKGEYEKGVGKEWHNISHIPNLTIG